MYWVIGFLVVAVFIVAAATLVVGHWDRLGFDDTQVRTDRRTERKRANM
jgi:hypothetical protein